MNTLDKKLIIILEAVSEYYYYNLYMISSLDDMRVDYQLWLYCNDKNSLIESDKYKVNDNEILSISEIEKRLDEIDERKTIIITSVCCGISKGAIALYRAISGRNIMYGAFSHVPYVAVSIGKAEKEYVGATHFKLSVLNIIYDFTHMRCKNDVTRLICNIMGHIPRLFGIKPLDFIIYGGTKSGELYLHFPVNSSTKKIFAHCNDTEKYLLDSSEMKEEICTFLDTNLFFGIDVPDRIKEDMMRNSNSYSNTFCRFFDSIENITGKPVVIAAHPRINNEQMELLKKIYGNRQICIGNTLELVKKSKFVFATITSAVKYAVLAKKEVFIIRSKELKRYEEFNLIIGQVAQLLGTEVVDIDNNTNDKITYDEYINKIITKKIDANHFEEQYCRKNTDDNRLFWQIVISELR